MRDPSDLDPEARPVAPNERLVLLDVLRGFALGGVFLANVHVWLSGRIFLPPERLREQLSSLANFITQHACTLLVHGKFLTLFSFLFGLGFSVQLLRAEARGASVVPLYTRRLGVLLLIGLTHLFALWMGDILSTYALLGFTLLWFRGRSDKALLLWACALLLGPELVLMAWEHLAPLRSSAPPEAAKAAAARVAEIRARTAETFANGSYLEVVRANAEYYLKVYLKPLTLAHFANATGKFLLGLLAGRMGLFQEGPRHPRFFRRLLGWGLVVGVLGNGVPVLFNVLRAKKLLVSDSPWLQPPQLLWEVGTLGLAAAYLAGLTLLFQRPRWRRVLSVLAPAGRMALTHYLSQTVMCLFIFYGFGLGLFGKLGPLPCMVLVLALFSVQVAWSHWWLARFQFGPAEWVWRSLTYGKAQPMRRPPEPVAGTAPTLSLTAPRRPPS